MAFIAECSDLDSHYKAQNGLDTFLSETIDSEMIDGLRNYYLGKDEPHRSCLLALRDIILNSDPAITETQKYGMPCFSYKKKPLCYLWTDKKTEEPYILMVDGKLLDHPQLEEGSRKRMKVFRVDPNKDLPLYTIQGILAKALQAHSKTSLNQG